ncbi:hypothetical protein Scep_014911 [Stephania cephalantha]|uniref:Uncharacterized protein n=1 Tax=Stephania cephalantha TaxID=152367 RepID=A0AAP0J2Y3_9MAGN
MKVVFPLLTYFHPPHQLPQSLFGINVGSFLSHECSISSFGKYFMIFIQSQTMDEKAHRLPILFVLLGKP